MDRQVVPRIQQHLIDHASLCHQDGKRRLQHAAVALANCRPDRCGGEVDGGIRVFERGFPGGDGFRLAEAGFDVAQPCDFPSPASALHITARLQPCAAARSCRLASAFLEGANK